LTGSLIFQDFFQNSQLIIPAVVISFTCDHELDHGGGPQSAVRIGVGVELLPGEPQRLMPGQAGFGGEPGEDGAKIGARACSSTICPAISRIIARSADELLRRRAKVKKPRSLI
jgi:hypothetical protein